MLPLTMFEIHEAKVASGGKKKPDPEVAQSGALSWPAPEPTSEFTGPAVTDLVEAISAEHMNEAKMDHRLLRDGVSFLVSLPTH